MDEYEHLIREAVHHLKLVERSLQAAMLQDRDNEELVTIPDAASEVIRGHLHASLEALERARDIALAKEEMENISAGRSETIPLEDIVKKEG